MKNRIAALTIALWMLGSCSSRAQTYTETIEQYRKKYIEELTTDSRAPIKPGDARYLRFFPIDSSYNVDAAFTPSPGAKPFLIGTHSGKQKPFKEYGILVFHIKDTLLQLHVYQSVDLINKTNHQDDLFIPFNDETNYTFTFGGGRYIDLKVSDIQNGHCTLDFNKCYNPYCAYAEGYSCPIPPAENRLPVTIPAGEKMYAGYTTE